MDDEATSTCSYALGERVQLTDPRLRDCPLLPGTSLTVFYNPQERVAAAGTESRMRKSKPVEGAEAHAVEPAEVPDVPAAPAAPVTVASVGVPATASGELSRLMPAGGEINGLSIVLALLAVLGGGAAWKFYSQRSRERHELAMRELELRAAGGGGQGPECKADAAALRADVQRLDGRLAQLEARQDSLVLPSVPDDLEDRLARLESAGKPARRSSKTGGK